MCRFCTKIYIKHKKISTFINKNLSVEIDKCIPVQLQYGIIVVKDINLVVHTNVCHKQKVFGQYANFGCSFFESINSPFLLWKFYLDVLCWIVFNICGKSVLPVILTSNTGNCRKYTLCNSANCFSLKTDKIKTIFFREFVNVCKKLVEFSSMSVNPYFIIDVFNIYKRGENFFNQYLEIERGRHQ